MVHIFGCHATLIISASGGGEAGPPHGMPVGALHHTSNLAQSCCNQSAIYSAEENIVNLIQSFRVRAAVRLPVTHHPRGAPVGKMALFLSGCTGIKLKVD